MKLATINVVARHGRADADPVVVGIRQAVRFMRASICFSTKQLKAAAAPATSQMPTHATAMRASSCPSGKPGTAKIMPMKAQKTISCTTRGLVSA